MASIMATMQYRDFLEKHQLHADLETQQLICCHEQCSFAPYIARSHATTHLRDRYGVEPGPSETYHSLSEA